MEDELTSLRDENRQLRELFIHLSKPVIRNLADRRERKPSGAACPRAGLGPSCARRMADRRADA
ncbi:MAG: hypothetical protein FJX62_04480 [Alphaproteobacteria bacterium]|nr:hypothetical protein [Alphaproteobacteria bacterium]